MVRKFDFLVIGSGLAGMSFALKVAHKGTVALICVKLIVSKMADAVIEANQGVAEDSEIFEEAAEEEATEE